MEEKVKTQTQEVPEKMTYEQLNNVAHQLSEQNRQLYMKLQEMNLANIEMRLKYLFKVVKYYEMFESDFANSCIKEIQELMTPPTEEESKEE